MKLPVKFPVLCTEPNVFRSGIWLLAEKQAILPNSLARHYRVIKDQYILALDSGQATAPTLHCYPLHPTNRMPAPKLLDRRPDTDPVLTEPLADAVSSYIVRSFYYKREVDIDVRRFSYQLVLTASAALASTNKTCLQLDAVI
jgi:hypothetical protein